MEKPRTKKMMVAEIAPGISQVMMHAFGIALNDGRLIVDWPRWSGFH